MMSDTIRSFGTPLKSSNDWINLDTVTVKAPPHEKFQSFWMRKGGSPHESARRLTEMLPVAASNLLCHCIQFFKEYLKAVDDPVGNELVELGVFAEGTPEERSNNNSEQHTVCFQYTINWYYYIALTVHSFNDILSDWYSSVHDWYMLNSKSIDARFTTFDGIMPLNTLYELMKKMALMRESFLVPIRPISRLLHKKICRI